MRNRSGLVKLERVILAEVEAWPSPVRCQPWETLRSVAGMTPAASPGWLVVHYLRLRRMQASRLQLCWFGKEQNVYFEWIVGRFRWSA